MEERLQKIIARAGIASRRHAEQLIASGLVTVNGKTVTEMGSKADAARDHIKVSGKLLRPSKELVYIALHKPAGVVSTMEDPEGRNSIRDLLHGISERVFPIGRLEYSTSGLLLLTNDGEMANEIMQSHGLRQTYHIKIKGRLTLTEIEELSRATGARISRLQSGRAQTSKRSDVSWYEVTLSEARRDALRNRLFHSGHPVEKTKRVGLGGVELGSLPPGQHRPLSGGELTELKKALKKPAFKKTPPTTHAGGGDKNRKAGRDKRKPPVAHYKA
ncbi:MAG: pseudouridine synthase [Candidatus Acidiferrales bacterium]